MPGLTMTPFMEGGGGAQKQGPRVFTLSDLLGGQLQGAQVNRIPSVGGGFPGMQAYGGGYAGNYAPELNDFLVDRDAATQLFGGTQGAQKFSGSGFDFEFDPTAGGYRGRRQADPFAGVDLSGIKQDTGNILRPGGVPLQPQAPPPPIIPQPVAPPPPPRPASVGWNDVGYQDVAPQLLDIAQLSQIFQADPAVMQAFVNERTGVSNQIGQVRGEIASRGEHAQKQLGQLPGQFQANFDQLGLLGGARGAAPGVETGERGSLETARNMQQAGYANLTPLLQQGYGEIQRQQSSNADFAETAALGEIGQRETGYQGQITGARQEAEAGALGENTRITNQSNQFNASNRSATAQFNASQRADVNKFNSQAQAAYDSGNYDRALEFSQLAQNAANQNIDLATQGFAPGMSLQDIATKASGRIDKDAATKEVDWGSIVGQLPPSAQSADKGLALQNSGVTLESLAPDARKAYDDVLKQINKDPNLLYDPEKLQKKTVEWKKKYGGHGNAVSLAMFAGDLPTTIGPLSGGG